MRAVTFAQSPEQADALLAEAKDFFRQSKFREADRAVRQYLESHPNSADGHFLLGHILFREIQAEAILDRQLALQVQGGMGGGIATPEPALPKDREEKAKASLDEFTAGAKYRNPSAADLKIVAFDYIVLADYPDADKWLTKMLEWAPNDSDGWYNLGRTKYNENRFAEAISAFQQCLKLDPKNVKAEDNLGLSFAGMGRNEEAAAAYQMAIGWQERSLAKNSRPYMDLGSLLIDGNRPKEAVKFLLQAVEIDSRDSKTHELLGKAYTRLEEFPKAQVELEKAVELSPQTPNLHCMLAPVYRKEGLAEKAKAEYERCAALTQVRHSPVESDEF
ncbi:MAG TPA: tetratricopeptide repeat protein [Candidatus Bathyarchaeia archaeon]|nr:tetratricopeptide repeat protein [Candidatus Bathyarchaeia archaeon]